MQKPSVPAVRKTGNPTSSIKIDMALIALSHIILTLTFPVSFCSPVWGQQKYEILFKTGTLKRQLYNTYNIIWRTCGKQSPTKEYGGDVWRVDNCLWGNMLPHKLFLALFLMARNNVTVVIESGRKGGMSAYTYSKHVPVVASVELNYIENVAETLSVIAPNIELISGNGLHVVPDLVDKYIKSDERVAVILDGPKSMQAAELAERIIDKCVFVILDDTGFSTPHGKYVLDRFGPDRLITSYDSHFLAAHFNDDVLWSQRINTSKSLLGIQLLRTIRSVSPECALGRHCKHLERSGLVAIAGPHVLP